MQPPTISIIIPVYNAEKYLNKCLESVINQTLKDIEIICINDGSTDNSLDILQKYAKQDNRFIIINQDSSGAGVARNAGLDKAQGEYLAFLDSDDFFELDML
jgi:glycosyltransferase involved in cell wall biosynthesis